MAHSLARSQFLGFLTCEGTCASWPILKIYTKNLQDKQIVLSGPRYTIPKVRGTRNVQAIKMVRFVSHVFSSFGVNNGPPAFVNVFEIPCIFCLARTPSTNHPNYIK